LVLEVAIFRRPAADEARLRALIRQMSMNNPVWGAPRIHGELLKLGFEVAQYSEISSFDLTPIPLRRGRGRNSRKNPIEDNYMPIWLMLGIYSGRSTDGRPGRST
jgi:hypothetical protein